MKSKILTLCIVAMSAYCHAAVPADTTNSAKVSPEVFDRAEVQPQFAGGPIALMKFIQENLKYPQKAKDKGLEGRVLVKFYIDVDGTVKNPVVLRDPVGEGASEEAIRLVNSMPKWTPGSQRGKPVKVYYTMPVTFKLPK